MNKLISMLAILGDNIKAVNVRIGNQYLFIPLTVNGWADTLVALDVYDYELVKIVENTLIVRKVV